MSELFDRGARTLLDRAYTRPSGWVGTRIKAPGPAEIAYFGALGINVLGRDELGRDRWAAAFIRAVYYQHKWHRTGRGWGGRRMVPNDARGIRYDIGVMKPALGVIPRGRAVRIMSVPGGQAAYRAAAKLPEARRIWAAEGDPGGRWADATARDW